jgi:uncharacterized repeat protein (TIGR03803 family)
MSKIHPGLRFVLAALALAMPDAAGAARDHTPSLVYNFKAEADGQWPGSLVPDGAGNLYGITNVGGDPTCACGTIFKIAPDGTKTMVHVFTGWPKDGDSPTGIVLDAQGNIYGTTHYGGRQMFGSIFKMTPDGKRLWMHSLKAPIHHFSKAPDGIWPLAGLTWGPDGNLYGTAWHGGVTAPECGEGGCGVVFQITPQGKFRRVYAFLGGNDGCGAEAGVSFDKTGMLYGVMTGCGAGNSGTVYKLDPSSGVETVLYAFQDGGIDGENPVRAPIVDDAGNVFGTTRVGGEPGCDTGCGILYKIAPDGTETVMHRFVGGTGDGAHADGILLRDKVGNFYGTTEGGGTGACNAGCGTIFKMTPEGALSILYSFRGYEHDDGEDPAWGLVAGAGKDKNVLYGTTVKGPGCCGSVFKLGK